MRITRMELTGERAGRFAIISRNYATTTIDVQIHHADGTGDRDCIDAGKPEEVARIASALQHTLDGFRGCSGDVASYRLALEHFAD